MLQWFTRQNYENCVIVQIPIYPTLWCLVSFFMEGVYSAEKNYMGKGIAVIKVMYITLTISTD